MLADTFGRPLRFRITPGQASDIAAASGLLEGQQARAVLADKAHDGNNLRDQIAAMDAKAVDPVQAQPEGPHTARQTCLQASQSDRTVLWPPQAFPPLRHALRPPRHSLHRLRAPRRHDLVTLNVDPT